jgi:protein-arginine kinase activator protein McsA
MRRQLKEAVARADYESAADLRDGIRRLEAEL